MTRFYTIIAALVLLMASWGGFYYFGTRADAEDDERRRADTLERVNNADTSKGNADDDRNWVRDFVDSLRPSD